MPVAEAVQTFVGIVNENEFYSHHYLAEVFKGDIRERLEQWAAVEEVDPMQRAPFKQLAGRAGQWFALRNAGTTGGDATEQLANFQQVQQGLLQALGYAFAPQHLQLQPGMPVPMWQVIGDAGKAPQVLTRRMVKHALKELLQGNTADDILSLSVCEPAMSSVALLNEAINQLAEKYLELKQAELSRLSSHEASPRELQKVRMYLADRHAFGVDMNPVAVELAEVSLWLNAIYGEDEAATRHPASSPRALV